MSEEVIYCKCGMTFRTTEGYRQHIMNGQHDESLERIRNSQ